MLNFTFYSFSSPSSGANEQWNDQRQAGHCGGGKKEKETGEFTIMMAPELSFWLYKDVRAERGASFSSLLGINKCRRKD